MPVNLSPIAGAGWQFFDNSGAVLAGGLLYTYAAGTTTPLATYQESSGSTVHSNPIILDSAGRVSTEVWMTAGSAYKLVLKTSTNVSLWTMDNLRGINDVSSVAWSAITGEPTTLAGYGITDGITAATAASTYAPLASPTFTGTASAKDEDANTYNIGWRDCPQTQQELISALAHHEAQASGPCCRSGVLDFSTRANVPESFELFGHRDVHARPIQRCKRRAVRPRSLCSHLCTRPHRPVHRQAGNAVFCRR